MFAAISLLSHQCTQDNKTNQPDLVSLLHVVIKVYGERTDKKTCRRSDNNAVKVKQILPLPLLDKCKYLRYGSGILFSPFVNTV